MSPSQINTLLGQAHPCPRCPRGHHRAADPVNAVRHSHATVLTVAVALTDDQLSIQVSDNGVGIPPGVTRSGLRNLHDRATGLHGTFTTSSPPGGGTGLTWTAPQQQEDPRAPAHDPACGSTPPVAPAGP